MIVTQLSRLHSPAAARSAASPAPAAPHGPRPRSAAAGAARWEGWLLLTTVLVAAVVSLVAMQRLWAGVFWGQPMEDYRPDSPETGRAGLTRLTDDVVVPLRLWAPGATLIGTQLAMFFGAGVLMPLVTRAAQGLTDTAPYVEAVLGR